MLDLWERMSLRCVPRSLFGWVRCIEWLCGVGGVLSFRCWGCRGTLSLFELVSSSCSVSLRSSLLQLILSPSPSFDRLKSRDTYVTSPFGVFTLSVVSAASRGTSGSFVSTWVRYGCCVLGEAYCVWRVVVGFVRFSNGFVFFPILRWLLLFVRPRHPW